MQVTDFFGEKVIYDFMSQALWGENKDGGLQKVADIRGWGAIQSLFKNKDGSIDLEKAETFQDDLDKWIAETINNRLDRERELG